MPTRGSSFVKVTAMGVLCCFASLFVCFFLHLSLTCTCVYMNLLPTSYLILFSSPSPPPPPSPLPSTPLPSPPLPSPPLHSPPPPNQGMLLSYNISNIVRTLLNLHSEQRKPMTKSSVLAICKLIELLKCIQYTFHRQSMTVATYITHIVNHYELNLLMGLDLSSVSSIHSTCVWVVCKLLVAKIFCFFSCCLL